MPGNDPLYGRLTTFAEHVLDAMPLPSATTFHMEMWHTPDDEVVFCEVASRTGGLRINETHAHAHGLDMDRQWFCAQVGLPVRAPSPDTVNATTYSAGNIGIYPGNGILAGLPETATPEGVVSQHVYGRVGEAYRGDYKSGDCLAAFVVTGESRDQVVSRFRSVASWFQGGTRWEPHRVRRR
jgi:hypothetical protein